MHSKQVFLKASLIAVLAMLISCAWADSEDPGWVEGCGYLVCPAGSLYPGSPPAYSSTLDVLRYGLPGDPYIRCGSESDQSPMNAYGINFRSYMAMLERRIADVWMKDREDRGYGKAVVRFKLDLEGKVSDLIVWKSSGSEKLDLWAIGIIKKAAPFSHLPPQVKKAVNIEFAFDNNPVSSPDISNNANSLPMGSFFSFPGGPAGGIDSFPEQQSANSTEIYSEKSLISGSGDNQPSQANSGKTFSCVLPDPDKGKVIVDRCRNFSDYMADLQYRIKQKWHPPKDSETKRTVVSFKVSETGDMSALKMDETSNSAEYDQSAMEAVEKAAPFGSLPAEAPEKVDVQFTFDKELTKPQQAKRNTIGNVGFDSEDWKQNASDRSNMMKKFFRQYHVIGMSRSRVCSLLGVPVSKPPLYSAFGLSYDTEPVPQTTYVFIGADNKLKPPVSVDTHTIDIYSIYSAGECGNTHYWLEIEYKDDIVIRYRLKSIDKDGAWVKNNEEPNLY